MVATPSLYLILNDEAVSEAQQRRLSKYLIDPKTGQMKQWIPILSKDKHSITIKAAQEDKDWQFDGFNAILEKPSSGRDMVDKCGVRMQTRYWLQGMNVTAVWTGPQLRVERPQLAQGLIHDE